MALWVGKLSRSLNEDDLKDAFEEFGKLSRCTLKKGYAFVTYERDDDADKAVAELNGNELKGSAIIVERAKPRNNADDGGCFKCGKQGHWAKDCTRGGGGGGRNDRYGGDRDRDRYSPRRRYSPDRRGGGRRDDRDFRRRDDRDDYRRDDRDDYRRRSPPRRDRDSSLSPRRDRDDYRRRSRSPSPSPRRDRDDSPRGGRRGGDNRRPSPRRERSPSPVRNEGKRARSKDGSLSPSPKRARRD